jgi:hypothetical protein
MNDLQKIAYFNILKGYYHSSGSEEIFGYFEAFGTPSFNRFSFFLVSVFFSILIEIRIGWSAWKEDADYILFDNTYVLVLLI